MKNESIELQVDGQKVAAQFYTPGNVSKNSALLFIHGWTGKPNNGAAQAFAERGYYTMTIILRGHEGSDGDIKTVTAQNALDDAKAAYDYVCERLSNSVPIVVIGNSYGSYIAALLSAERNISALSLRVPANYANAAFQQPKWGNGAENPVVMQWREQPLLPEANRALTAIHNFAGPIQIIEAEHDDNVPHQTVLNYVNAARKRQSRALDYQFMIGWLHSLGQDVTRQQQFQTILNNWLGSFDA